MDGTGNKLLITLVFVLVLIIIISTNPFNIHTAEYKKAKAEISKYIETHYGNDLILDEVSYNSKLGAYVANVRGLNNTMTKSFIAYFPNTGNIEDDYQYRVITRIEDELKLKLEALVTSSIDISTDSLQITPIIQESLTLNMSNEIETDIPIELNVEIKNSYSDLDKFSLDVYKILNSLYSSSLKFTKIEIYSFFPSDGDKLYFFYTEDTEKTYSLEEVMEIVYVKY